MMGGGGGGGALDGEEDAGTQVVARVPGLRSISRGQLPLCGPKSTPASSLLERCGEPTRLFPRAAHAFSDSQPQPQAPRLTPIVQRSRTLKKTARSAERRLRGAGGGGMLGGGSWGGRLGSRTSCCVAVTFVLFSLRIEWKNQTGRPRSHVSKRAPHTHNTPLLTQCIELWQHRHQVLGGGLSM